jgi:hypothetical protein
MLLRHLLPLDVPPPVPNGAEQQRIEHTRLRRRLMYGLGREDVRDRMRLAFGALRSDVIGEPDLSANPLLAACTAVAALYDRDPVVSHPIGPDAAAALSPFLRTLWPLMQRVQRDTVAMREMLMRVDWRVDASGVPEVVYRPVPPDMVVMKRDPSRPDHPIEVREAVQVKDQLGREEWIWSVWRVTIDGSDGYHAFHAFDTDEDVSERYGFVAQTGPTYQWRTLDGRCVLPFVLYHAAFTGALLDPYHGSELVYGTLDVAVLWTYHSHIIRNAAFEVRYTLGARIGADLDYGDSGGGPRMRAVADPTAVLSVQRDPDFDGQPQIGALAPSADPLAIAEAIVIRERRLIAFAGLSPADVHRTSGDPRSGYSLAITREGQREAQRRYAPVFSPIDEELVGLTATALRLAGGPTLPEVGWSVRHQLLPASPEERDAERRDVLELMSQGLLGRAEARAKLTGESLDQAQQALAAMQPLSGGMIG